MGPFQISGGVQLTSEQKSIRKLRGRLFETACLVSTFIGLFVLAFLLYDTWIRGHAWLNMDFLNNFPSRFPEKAGIKSALWGTVYLVSFVAVVSIPIGIGAAIYLEGYARKNRVSKIIDISISNLAGVPSIIYGILGLALFVRALDLGRSILSGALTMSLLVLPIIIITSREAIKAVPFTIQEASYALGATKWQTLRNQVLPAAFPWIITGCILTLSRAIGETAPLIMLGALTYVAFVPESLMDPFTVLPIQIFNWTSRPQEAFRHIAAAGIIVLLVVLLSMNAVALVIRNKYQKRLKW